MAEVAEPRAPPVPAWRIVHLDGTVRDQQDGDHPTRHLRPGSILAIQRNSEVLIIAPDDWSSVQWLTTVDVWANTGRAFRAIGPGISSDSTVRLWCAPSGPLVLTDGPVERAHAAMALLEASEAKEVTNGSTD